MKRLISLFACCIVLCSCSSALPDSSMAELSAIEKLDGHEREVFDSLILASDIFHNPSSLRLLEISAPQKNTNGGDWGQFYVHVQANNNSGGTSTGYYIIITKSNPNYDSLAEQGWIIRKSDSFMDNTLGTNQITSIPLELWETEHVGNINRALAEHWEELGL